MDILNDIINQFSNNEKEFDYILFDYNNYYKNEGINHIKKNLKTNIDDPLIDLILEKEAENIKQPLDEWLDRGFINNNPQHNNNQFLFISLK